MRFHIIGPFPDDLRKLRADWNVWLKKNQPQVRTIRAQAKKDEAKFSAAEIDDLLLPQLAQAERLSELLPLDAAAAPFKLGQREKVTLPNLASLMFFVEEDNQTLMLTGDGHHTDILRGLKRINRLAESGGLHVNILKVQHHGSEHNLDEAFCRTITADHYVFCGNGEYENPDCRVLQAIADSRLGTSAQLSSNPQVGNHFKFWINSSATAKSNADAKKHMRKVEALVRKLAKGSKGKMSFSFLKGSSFEISL
jgi:hypothetical protein